jgi:aryl-alcohol dehydrogenase-like predicted oxidoreductase
MQHSFGNDSISLRPLAGVERAASALVLGTSSFGALEHAAAVFDCFVAHGGNFFDTAHIYGQSFDPGCTERTLGAWMKSRGLRRELVILGKGGHPPKTPEAIGSELDESLDRLNTDYFDVYMLHRDSPEVPVAEFVDIMSSFLNSGRIHAYGFSNWTMERTKVARRYAKSKGLPLPMGVSNQLSLAVMEKPIYPGCVSASDRRFRQWLAESRCTLVPWSSQGRGVFTAIAYPEDLRSSALADCWYSETNVERLRRAHQLARLRGVLPVNIALGWVIQQPFPTFPIIGPRNVNELESSLGGLNVALSSEEIAWLNLESDGGSSAPITGDD